MKSLTRTLQILAIALALAACGESDRFDSTSARSTSAGQRLIGLKKALDAGEISQETYERQVREVLSNG